MVYTKHFTPNTHLGSKGRDILNSDGGRDVLYGGHGKDILIASDKSDKMHGGKHADTFAFTHNNRASRTGDINHAQVHTIMDFDHKEGDRIDLSDLIGYDKSHKIKYRGTKPFLGKGVEIRFIPGSIQDLSGSKSRLTEGTAGYLQSSPKEFLGLPNPFGGITKAIGKALGGVPVIGGAIKGATDAVSKIQTAVNGNVHHIINLLPNILPNGKPQKPTFNPNSIIANLPKGITDLPSIASDGWPIPGTDATLSFKPEVKPSFNLGGPYLPKFKIFPPGLSGSFGADITAGINLSGTATLNTGSIPGSGSMPTASFDLATASAPVPPPLTAGVSGSISVGQSLEVTEEGLNKSVGFKVGASAGATLKISNSPGVSNPKFNPTASLVGTDDLTGINYSASLGPGVSVSVGLGAKVPGPIDCGVDLIKGNLGMDLPLGLEIENNKANVTLGATLGVSADVLGIGCGPFSATAFPFDIASTNLGPKAVIPIT